MRRNLHSSKKIYFQFIVLLGLLLGTRNVTNAAIKITINDDTNWSEIITGSGIGGQPNSTDDIIITSNSILTVDISNGICKSIQVSSGNSAGSKGILSFSAGSQIEVVGSLTLGDKRVGTLDMTNGGLLKIGGSLTITKTGVLDSGTGTIEYNGSANQIVYGSTYNNLTLSGSGSKTTTGVAVNGVLSMEGTAKASDTPTYATGATLQYKGIDSRTVGVEFTNNFGGSGGLIIDQGSGNVVTLNANKTALTNITIKSGTLDLSTYTANRGSAGGTMTIAASSTLRIGGSNTFPSNYSTHVIDCASTVEYYGGNQTVANLNSSQKYGNLILSNGTKILQTGTTSICNNFKLDGATTTAVVGLTIGGDVILDRAFSFNPGAFTHNVGGNWTFNGWSSFNHTAGTINFTGYNSAINGTNTNNQSFYNITVSKSSDQFLSVSGNVGTLNITNDLVLTSGTFSPGTIPIVISGNWTNNGGTFTPGTAIITMNGSGKTIGGSSSTTFNNLNINNNSPGIVLGRDQFVNGTLTLSNGLLKLGGYNLTLGVDAPAISNLDNFYFGNMIVADDSGELRKIFRANDSYTFPIGDVGGNLSPITLNFTSGTYGTGAYASVRVTHAKHPSNPSATNYLTRYWTVTQSGISSFSCNVTCNYSYADVVGQGLQTAVQYTSTNSWVGYSTLGGGNLTAAGVTSFGAFTGAELAIISNLSTGSIIGSQFCAGSVVSVPINSTSSFASGNVFTAQLSNSTGGFGSPVNIGTLSSTTVGFISATIPANTTPGTGYRIRVISSNPAITATDNGNNLTVNASPTAPAIGTITQPTCAVATGSVALSGLPATGTWTLTKTQGAVISTSTGSGATTTISGLASGTYSYTVTNADNTVTCPGTGTGLIAQYYNTKDLTGPVILTRTDATIDNNWGNGSPDPSINSDNFSVRWRGKIQPCYSENYTFTTISDDGIRLWVNGAQIINNWNDHGNATDISTSISLTAGQKYDIVLEFYENGGGAVAHLSWSSKTQSSQIIPKSQLFTGATTGCTSVSSANIVINAIPTAPATPTASVTVQPTCGATTGTIVITAPTGGTTYEYQIDAGTYQASATFTGVAVGGHTVKARLAASPSCISAASTTLTVNAVPAVPATPTVGTITQPTCATATGSVVLNGLPATGTWTLTRTPGVITSTGTGTSSTISGLSANTYTYTVTNAAGCTSVASVNVVINTQPATPSAPTVGTITAPTCATATGSVVLNGLPATGTWTLTRSPGGTTTGTGASTTLLAINAGTYTYTVTNAAGCTSVGSASVIINTQPTTPTAPTVGTITQSTCSTATGSVILNGLPATGTWTLTRTPGGTTTGTGASTTLLAINAGTYTYTVTNAAGCTSVASVNVVINAQPATPSAPTVGTITAPTCATATGSVVLSGLPSGTWTINPGTINGSGTSTTISGLATGTYTYTVTNSLGCISATSTTVIINAQLPPPTITGTMPASRCGAGTLTLGATASAGIINWYAGSSGGGILGTGITYTTLSLSANATYYVDATNGGCTSTPRVAVSASIITPPIITATGAGTFCTGSTVNLASSGINFTSQYWTGPNNYYSIEKDPTLNSVTTSMTGTYTVTGSALSGANLVTNGDFELGTTGISSDYILSPSGLTGEGTYDVIVNPNTRHSAFLACGDHTSGTGKQMVINGSVTADKKVWFQSVNVVPNTNYQFTYWVQSVVGNNPSQMQLYVNGAIAGPIYTALTPTCQWIQFVYNWNSGSSTTADLSLINKNLVGGGNDFALDDIVFQQACEATSSVVVTINADVTAGSIGSTQSLCSGTTPSPLTSVTAGTGSGTISYEWQTDASGSYVTISGATSATYSPPALNVTTSYQRRTIAISGVTCNSPYTTPITITIIPAATSVAGAPVSTCSSLGAVNITAGSSATNYASVTWTSSGIGTITNANSLTLATYTPSLLDILAGSVTLTLTAYGNSPCGNAVSTKIFTITPDGSWIGDIDSDWNNPGNWACNQLPTLTSNVVIANGKLPYPILSAGAVGEANSLNILPGASVTVTGNTLQIAGLILNTGTINATAGTIEMKGTLAQTLGLGLFVTNTILNLTIDKPLLGATLLGPLNISGIVKVSKGTLNSGGFLTLLSTATQTALIDGTGSGQVMGNVNMQRYIPLLSGFGYKYFSSPFQAATVNEFTPEVILTAAFPTFYSYDEDNHKDSSSVTVYRSGWVNYITPGNTLFPLAGYAANFGSETTPAVITVNIAGEVNNGALATTLYNHHRKYTKGFNLVGNPYPSPIDWAAVTGWTKTNIDSAMYFFNASNQYSGSYSSYVKGVATGNAGRIIAAMQGFFVHVTDGAYPVTGTLGITNPVRINNLTPVFKNAVIDNRVILRFAANFETKNPIDDAAVIYFDQSSSLSFDKDLDALKMTNTDVQVPNLYTLTPETTELSINGMPLPTDSLTRIPLGITTFMDGWINFKAMDISRLPDEMYIYLVDAETGKQIDLQRLPDYRFFLKTGIYNNRFTLEFSLSELTKTNAVAGKMFNLSRSGDYLKVKANLPSNIKGNLLVTNLLGQTIIRREVTGDETVEINQNVSTGVYVITLISGKKTYSEKLIMRTNYE